MSKATVVEAICVSKKESASYYGTENPIQTTIELQVPYDPTSVYFQLSGGSNFILNTVNQAAADQFKIGSKHRITVELLEETPAPEA